MKVKITRTMPVAVDGIHVRKFTAGKEEDVNVDVARLLVDKLKIAEYVRERAVLEPSSRAVITEAPEKTEPPEEPEVKKNGAAEGTEGTEGPDVKVFELAQGLGMATKAVLNACKKLKIKATAPASKISAVDAKAVVAELEKK